ncbi:MAG TPA: hypothetical protein PLG23_13300 [Thermoflexales bacterium]|jgi:hypothetical protein|nr:hypothetical protein [Anaerolineae bacterium]HQV28293.1 hypothetical protein [Thermoflexales bacterium]HQX11723.1 hypothetical protein [Thermoflexales bacterium]HQY25548.1 hypothetical protein [Thermoflexales bacterium]HQZ54440.1 hypothetical protein [Thermoflexales bacterium]
MDFTPPFAAWLKARRRQRDLLAPKLDKIRNAALAREEYFAQWRAGEGMSLDDAAALMAGVLERVGRQTADP